MKPFIGLPDKPTDQWMCHAGEQPWPHYWSHPPEDAFRSLWVLEGEGEKVADYAASAGFVCISHPGHNRTDEAILRRYRELKTMVAMHRVGPRTAPRRGARPIQLLLCRFRPNLPQSREIV